MPADVLMALAQSRRCLIRTKTPATCDPRPAADGRGPSCRSPRQRHAMANEFLSVKATRSGTLISHARRAAVASSNGLAPSECTAPGPQVVPRRSNERRASAASLGRGHWMACLE